MEQDYPSIIKQILSEYSQIKPANGEIEREVIFDDTGKHYQLLQMGWIKDKKRVFRPSISKMIKFGFSMMESKMELLVNYLQQAFLKIKLS
jgi:hypothetical protein